MKEKKGISSEKFNKAKFNNSKDKDYENYIPLPSLYI